MNFYPRHIGDYLKDTAHLSLLEHGVYGRLLDVYYTREVGIEEADAARLVGARSKEERTALGQVLGEFFVLQAGVWTHRRCDAEIERFHKKAEHNREVGKLGGRPRKSETQPEPKNNPDGFQTEPKQNPPSNQNQEPEPTTAPKVRSSGPAASAAPPPFDGKNAEALNGKAVVQVAESFELPEQWGYDAEALGFKPAEVLNEAEKFRQYWTSGKGAGKRRNVKGWRQTWSNWLGKAAENRR